jgi:hypothetical protein
MKKSLIKKLAVIAAVAAVLVCAWFAGGKDGGSGGCASDPARGGTDSAGGNSGACGFHRA